MVNIAHIEKKIKVYFVFSVVKQRIQMVNSPYKGILECARRTYHAEGLQAFYRSYTTQLTMNVPFQSIHFITYEMCQNFTNPDRGYNPAMHMTSGAIAGRLLGPILCPNLGIVLEIGTLVWLENILDEAGLQCI